MSIKPVWFVPRTRDRPPAASLNLGDVIATPDTPEEPINGDPPPAVPTDRIRWLTEEDWSWSKETAHARTGGIFANFLSLAGIGGNFDVTSKGSLKEVYNADFLVTVYFSPTTAYIKKCLEDEDVSDVLKGPNKKKRVFMITGLKTAYGASKALELMKERGFQFQLGVDLTSLGLPITIGPKIGNTTSTNEKGSGRTSDFVFGFKRSVLRYKYGQVVHEPFTDGALHDLNGRKDKTEMETEVNLDDWELDDAKAEDFEIPKEQTVDEHGEAVDFIVV